MRSYRLGMALRTALCLALTSLLITEEQAWSHGGSHGTPEPSSPTEKAAPPTSEKGLTRRPMQPPHGGQMTATEWHYFEVVYTPQETRIYVYLPTQRPMNARGITGEAVLRVKSSGRSFRYPIRCVAQPTWMDDLGYLAVAVDVSEVQDGDMEVAFDLKHLPSREEAHARFTQTFALAQPPLHVSRVQLTEADRPAVFQQRLCPVTNTSLGEHGPPIKLMVAEQPLYVCCEGCVSQVQNDPRIYLRKAAMIMPAAALAAARPQIVVMYATADDRPAIQAQGICPVMGQPLGAHGDPIKILLDGRPLFVCCWHCVQEVGQNPGAYLGKGLAGAAICDRLSASASSCANCSSAGTPGNTGASGGGCRSCSSR